MSPAPTPPPVERPPRRSVPQVLLWASLAGVAGLLVLHFFPPGQYPIYPVCPLKQGTGLDCPGCGGLRALHQLTNGNFSAAWQLNPVAVLLLPLLGYEASIRLPAKRRLPSLLQRPLIGFSVVVLLIAFGILRNLPALAQFPP